MKNILVALLGVLFCGLARAGGITTDTSDPLFLQARGGALVQSGAQYFEDGVRLNFGVSYGLTDRLVLGGRVHYQQDFSGPEDGFSSINLGGIYRAGTADEGDNNMIYDVLFGLKFGGSHRVRMPGYADSTYYMGVRFGRQYAGMTLAGTVKSTWIFDDARGMAYIDFIPEIYFRIDDDWRAGGAFELRKATNSDYNEETIGVKLVRQYGYTQYIGHIDYAFEARNIGAGIKINILF